MVIKSLSRKSGTEQVIKYLFKDEKKLSNKDFKPLVMRHNLRTRTLDKMIKEFKANETFRRVKRKDSVKVYHEVISFSKEDKDKITEKMLRDFGKKYMELRGKHNLYIITQHVEKDHIHLHCVVSGTKYLTGEANRMSKAEFGRLKVAMQTFQKAKHPELTKSIVAHSKGKGYSKDARQTNKNKLEVDLRKAYQQSKSTQGFLEQLKKLGHEPYYRNEKLAGVKYAGETKFRFSRLNFDDKLKALARYENEEKRQLKELENLRGSRSNPRERSFSDDINISNQMESEDEQENDYTR